ncbi:TPA: LamG domain-containing protein [Candidatus Poribacteria bacterium]|nr:LamG domain-containing protein [Candidatus Poribacteria bacterium]HIP08189.1 LamG domain-containing protein [Rhodospirillales bacterium]
MIPSTIASTDKAPSSLAKAMVPRYFTMINCCARMHFIRREIEHIVWLDSIKLQERKLTMSKNILRMTFVLVILLAVLIYTNAETQIVKGGLVSYWSLDKSKIQGKAVKDSTGNHNGTIEGDLKSVAGQIGEALQFDGNSDNYVLIKDAKTFDFNADFTWMAWVKTGNSGPGCIFAKTGARGGDDQGPKTWWIVNSVQSFDTGWVGNVEDTEAISDNKWHHLAIAATAKDSSIQYYVDGEATGGGSIAFASKPDEWEETFVQIGIDGRVDGELGFFEGAIDEVGIYDRVLSGAEVKQNSKSVAGPAVAVADPSGKLAVTWGKIKMSQ